MLMLLLILILVGLFLLVLRLLLLQGQVLLVEYHQLRGEFGYNLVSWHPGHALVRVA